MGAVARLEHHFGGVGWGMALEGAAPAGRIDPGIADAPEQQQRAAELGKQLIEGLALGDIEHGAEHPKGAGIQRWQANRLHQGLIHVGFVDVHLVEGAANRGRPAQVFKQDPLQHGAFEQGAADGLAGDLAPTLRRSLLIAEGARRIQQHHPGRLVAQGRSSRQGCKTAEGIAHQHRGPANAFGHIGAELVSPEGAAIGELGRLGAAAKAQQINGMHLVVLSKDRDVVAEVVGGGAKAMHQQNRRPDGLLGGPAEAVHGMAQVAPAFRTQHAH